MIPENIQIIIMFCILLIFGSIALGFNREEAKKKKEAEKWRRENK